MGISLVSLPVAAAVDIAGVAGNVMVVRTVSEGVVVPFVVGTAFGMVVVIVAFVAGKTDIDVFAAAAELVLFLVVVVAAAVAISGQLQAF